MFSVSGSRTEMMGDKINAYNMYIQTLHLIKYVMKLTGSKNNKKDVDIRLAFLASWWLISNIFSQACCSFTPRAVLTEPETVQDEEAWAEGLPEDHPGRAGKVGGWPASCRTGSDQSHTQSCRQWRVQLLQGLLQSIYKGWRFLTLFAVKWLLLKWGEQDARGPDTPHCPTHLPQHPQERDAEPVQLLQLPQSVPRAVGAGRPLCQQGPVWG